MPPKHKQTKQEWRECTNCHLIVHSKDQTSHISECENSASYECHSHGYISNDCLHGVPTTQNEGIRTDN